jgi:hypothetical protein
MIYNRISENLKNTITNQVLTNTGKQLVEAQKKLIANCLKYQKKDQRKFYEAVMEYMIEMKYIYSLELQKIFNEKNENKYPDHVRKYYNIAEYIASYENHLNNKNITPENLTGDIVSSVNQVKI